MTVSGMPSGEVKRRLNDQIKTALPIPGPQPNGGPATINSNRINAKHDYSGNVRGKKHSPWTDAAWRVFGTIMALALAIRLYRLGMPEQVVYSIAIVVLLIVA